MVVIKPKLLKTKFDETLLSWAEKKNILVGNFAAGPVADQFYSGGGD